MPLSHLSRCSSAHATWRVGGALLALALGIAGCSCDEEEPAPAGNNANNANNNTNNANNACTPGALNCTCDNGACNGEDLMCDRGYCVPDDGTCTRGQLDCACRDDNTCDAPLACQQNVCVNPDTGPGEGELGGPCHANNTCDDFEGQPLDCVNNLCELPGCPSGSLGCPCGPAGVCDDANATCNADNRCERTGCTAGEEGCACAANDACNGDLACDLGLCRYRNRLSAALDTSDARSCDVLALQGERAVEGVVFSEDVVGEWIKEGDKIGLSFLLRADAPLTSRAFTVAFAGPDRVDPAALTLSRVECFNAEGRPIANPALSLGL